MPRKKTLKRGRSLAVRAVLILLACGTGYLIGGIHTTALRSAEVSAAEAAEDISAAELVALRFPNAWTGRTSAAKASPPRAATKVSAATIAGDTQLALLSPEPMIPQMIPQIVPQAAAEANPSVTSDAIAETGTQNASPVADQSEPQAVSPPPRAASATAAAARLVSQPKAAAAAAAPHRPIINRPGYMLNDAQIASIKERLHLTPDQAQMWPGVEAALRNMAYTRVQEARAHGGNTNTQVAAVDPDAVQGLKSAAVPLILSFNSEQKEEVRSIVHVMGLDQLASQF